MNSLFHTDETIAAIATAIAAGNGGIAVIRISGKFAKESSQNILEIPGEQVWESHKILYGYIKDQKNESKIDEVLVLYMESPRSFTGEDIVEIHCHGGLIVVQRVLDKLLEDKKVRRALPGEFSQRAVLNGRLDLTQAEAINDLIEARSNKAAQLAMSAIDGGISKVIKQLRERLLDQLSEIEARVDFEDDLPPLQQNTVLKELAKIKIELNKLIDNAKKGLCIQRGIKVAIIGRPNVGKSSLLNRLSNSEKAIVTAQPGTTRDLIESEVILQGIPITLIDTAGIRATGNEIERLGIERSQKALKSADVIALVFDITHGWTKDDEKIRNQIPTNIPQIFIGNKLDIQKSEKTNSKDKIPSELKKHIKTSAMTGEGEEVLIENILAACGASNTQGLDIALNERQKDLAQEAVESIKRTQEVAAQKLPWDFWTIDLREAISRLGEITGGEITEAVLNRIFSRFCIGK